MVGRSPSPCTCGTRWRLNMSTQCKSAVAPHTKWSTRFCSQAVSSGKDKPLTPGRALAPQGSIRQSNTLSPSPHSHTGGSFHLMVQTLASGFSWRPRWGSGSEQGIWQRCYPPNATMPTWCQRMGASPVQKLVSVSLSQLGLSSTGLSHLSHGLGEETEGKWPPQVHTT